MSQRVKVIIASGGTGGHLYPGIALGEELAAHYAADVIYAVGKNDRAIKILESKGWRIAEFSSHPFPRGIHFIYRWFVFLWWNIVGTLSAIFFIRKEKPDVVVGMGAYVSFPVILAAKLFRLPVLIHEQNSVPGLANRILGYAADRVAVSFPSSVVYFKNVKKVMLTGNPVRKEIVEGFRRNPQRFGLSEGKFTILVMGGSQGASGVNKAVANREFLESIRSEFTDDIQIIHLTGAGDFEVIKQIYNKMKFPSAVYPYIDDGMGEVYGSSDIIICRAGATTIAELSVVRIPAVFIPFPYATDDHQTKNAVDYLSTGAPGVVIREQEITPDKLFDVVKFFYKKQKEGSAVCHPPHFTHTTPLPQVIIAEEIFRLSHH